MDYFSKLLRGAPPEHKAPPDDVTDFHRSWILVKNTLSNPDERQIRRGITSTDVPARLKLMVDALLRETNTVDESTGACMDYLLTNDVLSTLVRLSESDRPFGVQAEALRTISSLVVLLDEHFLVHSAVHKAVIRLLRNCVGDDSPENFMTGSSSKPMGAAGVAARVALSEYEEDLVNLLCVLCGRIRTYPELLMIFFHDKNWFSAHGNMQDEDDTNPDEDYDEEDDEEEAHETEVQKPAESDHSSEEVVEGLGDRGDLDSSTDDLSATPTVHTIALANPNPTSPAHSAPHSQETPSVAPPKPQYEFLIFNYLMRFVHREGATGEYARAGLLFLIDIAMAAGAETSQNSLRDGSPVQDAALALAEYILEGDFSEVLGAGLGAVYSLLPYKLEVKQPPSAAKEGGQGGGMTLGTTSIGSAEEEKVKSEEEERRSQALGSDVSTSPEFRARLDHFLKLVEFLQDVLKRTSMEGSGFGIAEGDDSHLRAGPSTSTSAPVGRAIAQSVVDNMRNIFLQNVLYPSILESSDHDGSAVAVMSYIDTLLQTLPHGQLSDALVEFLIADDDGGSAISGAQRRQLLGKGTKGQRRRSSAMVLLELEAPNSSKGHSSYFSSLGRFTLKDLLISNLKSTSSLDGIAALKLLHTLFTEHCDRTVDGLLAVVRDPHATAFPSAPPLFRDTTFTTSNTDMKIQEEDDSDDDEFHYPGQASLPDVKGDVPHTEYQGDRPMFVQPTTTIATLERQLGMYQNLIARINPSHNENAFSTGFDHYLRDALEAIQGQCCYSDGWLWGDDLEGSKSTKKHRLLPTDPLINTLLHKLRSYFSHTPDYNIALTGALADLSACPNRSLAGWLTLAVREDDDNAWASAQKGTEREASLDCDGDDRSVDHEVDDRLASENPMPSFDSRLKDAKAMPVLYTTFAGLVGQLDRYRALVDDFDRLLAERRQGLLFAENLTDALSLELEIPSDALTSSTSALSMASTTSSPSVKGKGSTSPKPKSKTNVGSFVSSLLTSKKSAKSKSTPGTPQADLSEDPLSSSGEGGAKFASASPFAPHYQKTNSVSVPSLTAAPPSVGPWSIPAKRSVAIREDRLGNSTSFNAFSADEEDVFASRARTTRFEDEDGDDSGQDGKEISLSRVLDNVVILEEVIKELTAIVQARCSLGIDAVRYV